MNRKSFLGKFLIGVAAVVTAPYLPKLSASVAELQSRNISYIAGYMKVSRQMLNDIPYFITFLQERLLQLSDPQ